jgi:hypothetical protein
MVVQKQIHSALVMDLIVFVCLIIYFISWIFHGSIHLSATGARCYWICAKNTHRVGSAEKPAKVKQKLIKELSVFSEQMVSRV